MPARDFEFATPAPSYSTPATDVAAATPTTITHAPSVSSQVVGSVNLLDWDEEIPSIQPAVSPMASSTAIKSVTLSDQIDITPVKFQELWTSLPDAISGPICTLSQAPATVAELEPLLLNSKVLH